MTTGNPEKGIYKILEEIKKLLILQLLLNGAKSEGIARLLGVDSGTIRHLIPIKKIKRTIRR